MKVSAEYKINYSTAKTLIRNEKLQKGKIMLSELNYEVCSSDKEPTQPTDDIGIVASYKSIDLKQGEGWAVSALAKSSKIEIISRISFPSWIRQRFFIYLFCESPSSFRFCFNL